MLAWLGGRRKLLEASGQRGKARSAVGLSSASQPIIEPPKKRKKQGSDHCSQYTGQLDRQGPYPTPRPFKRPRQHKQSTGPTSSIDLMMVVGVDLDDANDLEPPQHASASSKHLTIEDGASSLPEAVVGAGEGCETPHTALSPTAAAQAEQRFRSNVQMAGSSSPAMTADHVVPAMVAPGAPKVHFSSTCTEPRGPPNVVAQHNLNAHPAASAANINNNEQFAGSNWLQDSYGVTSCRKNAAVQANNGVTSIEPKQQPVAISLDLKFLAG